MDILIHFLKINFSTIPHFFLFQSHLFLRLIISSNFNNFHFFYGDRGKAEAAFLYS